MSDRTNALTVTLGENVRTDDVQPLIDAIMQFKGVISVDANVTNITDHVAQMRTNRNVTDKLFELIQEINKKN